MADASAGQGAGWCGDRFFFSDPARIRDVEQNIVFLHLLETSDSIVPMIDRHSFFFFPLRSSGSGLGCFWLACLGMVSPLWGEPWELRRLDGERLVGELRRVDRLGVVIASTQGEERIDIGGVDTLRPLVEGGPAVSNTAPWSMDWLALTDGSRLACQTITGKDDRWTIAMLGQSGLELPRGTVESLRFAAADNRLEESWQSMVGMERSSDQLVIIRAGDTTDLAPGLIGEMDRESVEFSFDGQTIRAPRGKLLGLLWYRPRSKRAEPAIQVQLRDGSRWEAIELDYDMSVSQTPELAIQTRAGVSVKIRWEHLASINFSAANVVWLAQEVPLAKAISSRSWLAQPVAGRDEMLGPRFVAAEDSGEAKAQDLRFWGPGEISFRIPEGFTRFVSKLRRSEQARFAATVGCEVWDGETRVWEGGLTVEQSEVAIDVPVTPGKKLRLVVHARSDLMIGTELSWEQPRLTR
jgi:hypothetical protein